MFAEYITSAAHHLLQNCRVAGLLLTSAESCTGGLIAAALTEIPGSSDVFERGFVTYSNLSKTEMLGVPAELVLTHGAVSRQVAEAMAQGALANSRAGLAIAVTGIAGPGGGTEQKPVGLVHIAAAIKSGRLAHEQCRFEDSGRSAIRINTMMAAFRLARSII